MEDLKRLGFEIGDLGFWVRVRETNEREGRLGFFRPFQMCC